MSDSHAQYSNLNELLSRDHEAQNYFNTLPEHVQGYLWQRAENISSVAVMHAIAEEAKQMNH